MEDRLRAVEDRLAIFQLIASHPPAADTGNDGYYRDAFVADGVIDLGGGKTRDRQRGDRRHGEDAGAPRRDRRRPVPFRRAAARELDGDTAVAISYFQMSRRTKRATRRSRPATAPRAAFASIALGANRWDLKRTATGWKVVRRSLRMLDGSREAQDLLKSALA